MTRSRLEDFALRMRGVRRQEELDLAAVAAVRALQSAGVPALVLKGPALARLLYREGEARGYSDVDLLVPHRHLASARQVLARLGYIWAARVLGIDDVADIEHSEVWARAGVNGAPLQIDLHWRLDRCEAPADVLWDVLATSCGSIYLEGEQVPVPGDDGLAFHVAIHAAQHGPKDPKAMGDLARGIQRWPATVWQRAAEVAEKVEGLPAFAAGLRLLPEGATVADELGLPPTSELDWEIQHHDARPRGTFHFRALIEASGFRQRANVIRRSLFPTRRWIGRQYPWVGDSDLRLVLAYARHVLRAPLWALRAGRFLARARRAGQRR